MIWIMSLLLTGLLLAALLSIVFPQLLAPFFAERWRRNIHYRDRTHY